MSLPATIARRTNIATAPNFAYTLGKMTNAETLGVNEDGPTLTIGGLTLSGRAFARAKALRLHQLRKIRPLLDAEGANVAHGGGKPRQGFERTYRGE